MTAATTLSELQDQIRLRYDELSKRLQQVGQYLLDNPDRVAFDTVAVIASEANVPPSTLIRFANAFGFAGFNDMKHLFRRNLVEETSNYSDRLKLFRALETDEQTPHTPPDILRTFAQANANALEQLAARTPPEQLDQAINLLHQAETIYIVGLRRSFSIASYLTYALRHVGRRTILIDGLGGMFNEQLGMIGEKDAVIAISFTPYANETVEMVEKAVSSGAKLVSITDSRSARYPHSVMSVSL